MSVEVQNLHAAMPKKKTKGGAVTKTPAAKTKTIKGGAVTKAAKTKAIGGGAVTKDGAMTETAAGWLKVKSDRLGWMARRKGKRWTLYQKTRVPADEKCGMRIIEFHDSESDVWHRSMKTAMAAGLTGGLPSCD